jgi:hypothetical protein
MRAFNRMPNDYYLMDKKEDDGKNEANGQGDIDDELLDDFFDFVVLDKELIESQIGNKGKSKKDLKKM